MFEPNKSAEGLTSSSLQHPPWQQPSTSAAPHFVDVQGGNLSYVPPTLSANDNIAPAQRNLQQQQQEQQQEQGESFYKGVHPFAAFFHVAFKLCALLTFIFGGLFSSAYVTIFVVTILFLAADFWTTKNVTGRLLVCLRWWNDIKDDGSSEWIFESAPDADRRVNGFDRWFFWITTGANCAVWLLMILFNLMSFTRLPMTVLGFILGGANFVGFLKCSRDAKTKMTQFMLNRASQHQDVLRQAVNAL